VFPVAHEKIRNDKREHKNEKAQNNQHNRVGGSDKKSIAIEKK